MKAGATLYGRTPLADNQTCSLTPADLARITRKNGPHVPYPALVRDMLPLVQHCAVLVSFLGIFLRLHSGTPMARPYLSSIRSCFTFQIYGTVNM